MADAERDKGESMTTAQNYMASLEMGESLVRLQSLLVEMRDIDKDENAAKKSIDCAKEAFTIREAELLMEGIEGKNETERKAALRVKADKDASALNIVRNLRNGESDLSAAMVKGASLRREWQFHRIKLEVGIAKLAFLGGAGYTVEAFTNNHGSDLYG